MANSIKVLVGMVQRNIRLPAAYSIVSFGERLEINVYEHKKLMIDGTDVLECFQVSLGASKTSPSKTSALAF